MTPKRIIILPTTNLPFRTPTPILAPNSSKKSKTKRKKTAQKTTMTSVPINHPAERAQGVAGGDSAISLYLGILLTFEGLNTATPCKKR